MPDPFISSVDLTDYLGRDVTADNGALIAIDAACDICRDIAEQDFNFATSTISLDGSGSDVLVLPQRPVSGAGTILVNGAAEPAYSFTPNGLLFRGSAGGGFTGSGWFGGFGSFRPVWPRGRQNVQVTYDHGFGTADMPRSVRMVALALAGRLVVQGAAIAETVGPVSVRYAVSADDLTTNELRILRKYRGASS